MQFARHMLTATFVVGAVSAAAQALDPCADGVRYFKARDYAAARPLLERCVEAHPEDLEALLALTVVATSQESFAVAVGYGERLVAAAPQDANARYWYGRALLGAGRAAEGQAQWEAGLELSQTHRGILEGLARLALERGEEAKAYNLVNQLRMHGGDEGWVHRLLADIARRRSLWDQAAEHWRDALARDGETPGDLVVLGELTILAGKADDAVGVFRRAVTLEESGATWGGLGEAYFAADQIDSARTALRRAVELAPAESRHVYNLANVLEISGQAAEAGELFERYVNMMPQDPVGHLNYAIHLEKLGRSEGALEQATRALELDPGLTVALVTKARSLERLERWEEAAAAVARLAERDTAAAEELAAWRADLLARVETPRAGQVLLAHIVTGDPKAVAELTRELAAGTDFASLAMRFSQGPTAAQGGRIGWVDPSTMVAPLRAVIERLAVGQTSPLVESGGLHHAFKRIR